MYLGSLLRRKRILGHYGPEKRSEGWGYASEGTRRAETRLSGGRGEGCVRIKLDGVTEIGAKKKKDSEGVKRGRALKGASCGILRVPKDAQDRKKRCSRQRKQEEKRYKMVVPKGIGKVGKNVRKIR